MQREAAVDTHLPCSPLILFPSIHRLLTTVLLTAEPVTFRGSPLCIGVTLPRSAWQVRSPHTQTARSTCSQWLIPRWEQNPHSFPPDETVSESLFILQSYLWGQAEPEDTPEITPLLGCFSSICSLVSPGSPPF